MLSSLRIKESKAPGFMEPAACISKEHFKAQKALEMLLETDTSSGSLETWSFRLFDPKD